MTPTKNYVVMESSSQSGSRLYEAETVKESCDKDVDFFNVTRSKNKKKGNIQIVSQSTNQTVQSTKGSSAKSFLVKQVEPLPIEAPLVHDIIHSDEEICRSVDTCDSEGNFLHGQFDEVDTIYSNPIA